MSPKVKRAFAIAKTIISGLLAIVITGLMIEEPSDFFIYLILDLFFLFDIFMSIEYAKDKIDGIIFISSFPCGPDSLVNELVIRKIKIPCINIVLDDLDALAGIETRLESFMDILEGSLWKRKN